MIVVKKLGVALALLVSFELSSLGDTRVEAYHHTKQHHGPSRLIDRPASNKPYYNRYDAHYSQPVPSFRPIEARINHRPHIYHDSYHFRHKGHLYRYRHGLFYRPYKHGFRLVTAPIGAVIFSLPMGSRHLHIKGRDYYHYHDVYYQRVVSQQGYRVVEPPYRNHNVSYRIGDVIDTLPLGASAVIIDNVRYYEYNNNYFRPQRRNGMRRYLVVDF